MNNGSHLQYDITAQTGDDPLVWIENLLYGEQKFV